MDHEGRIGATRDAVRYLSEHAATHSRTQVPNTPAWTVGEVATHVGWALLFWRHMMDSTPHDPTSRERALAETPPFPPDLHPDEFSNRVEPVLAHMAADEHAECYVSMAGGPGTRGLWARHAMSEIGVHQMDVEAALGEPHKITVGQAHDAVDYVATFVLPAFRRTTGEDPGALILEFTDTNSEVMSSISIESASSGEAVVRGPVREILLALWGRPHDDVDVRHGDADIWRSWLEQPGRSFQFAQKD